MMSLKQLSHFFLIILFLLGPISRMSGQVANSRTNYFLTASGGLGFLTHDFSVPGINKSLEAGKWANNPCGIRISLWHCAPLGKQPSAFGAELNAMWEPNVSFSRYDVNRIWTYFLQGGAGAIYQKDDNGVGDKDLFLNIALTGSLRITQMTTLQASLGAHLFPAGFNHAEQLYISPYLTLGFTETFHRDDYRRYHRLHNDEFFRNWNLSGALGINTMLNPRALGSVAPSPALDFSISKPISNLFEGRFRISGLQSGYSNERFLYCGAGADIMCNVLNINKRRYIETWNLDFLGGISLVKDIGDKKSSVVAIDGGLILKRKMSVYSDLFVEARGYLMPSRFSNTNQYLMATFLFGYTYKML